MAEQRSQRDATLATHNVPLRIHCLLDSCIGLRQLCNGQVNSTLDTAELRQRSVRDCRRLAALEVDIVSCAESGVDTAVNDKAGWAIRVDRQTAVPKNSDAGIAFEDDGAGDVSSANSAAPPDFNPGDWVKGKSYGSGQVVKFNALPVTVEFEAGQQRGFQADYLQRAWSRRLASPVANATDTASDRASSTFANS